jgi:1-acyl-sn-glycerol-3-phosphate acyltransferase
MISNFASIPRFVTRSLLLSGFLLFLLIPTLMRVKHHRRMNTEESEKKADLIAIRLGTRLAWFFGIQVKSSGTPVQGAVLFAANHISWLDIPALHSVCAMGFVGKAEIEQWPIFRFIARTGGTIFHQRGSHDSAADVSAVMAQRLQAGRAVTIFPEGGIKPGSAVRVFHARMFRAAVDVGCQVQPVSIRYMRDGRIDDDVSFRVGENMLPNLLRQLTRPASMADIHFSLPIDATDQPRRLLADAARAAVISHMQSKPDRPS